MNLAEQLTEKIGKNRLRVLVIGDAISDVWVHGRITSCQDGCPKFTEESRCVTDGGAANARRCVGSWGVTSLLVARAENDRPIKCRFVDERGVLAFRHDDEGVLRSPDDYEWLRCQTLALVEMYDAVLLSDYDKGFLTPELIRQVAELCRSRSIPCVADAKRFPELYDSATIKANHDWAKLWRCCDREVVTRGSDRPLVNGRVVGENLPTVNCVNHVGAGDCFAATFTVALTYGFPIQEAAAIAHSAGRVYVQHPYNRPPQPHEVAADMASGIASAASGSGDGPGHT